MSTVAETVVQVLSQAGVKRLYGVVRDSLNSVVDTVRAILVKPFRRSKPTSGNQEVGR